MGRGDSSAQHGGPGELCSAGCRTAQAAAPHLTPDRGQRSWGAWALLVAVRLYIVFLSPILGGACKFYPSCSNYAYEAVSLHGAWRGGWLAIRRLVRCRPFTPGGFDPVPEIVYPQDLLRELPPHPVSAAHRPTQAVVSETWSAAGPLGVERRL